MSPFTPPYPKPMPRRPGIFKTLLQPLKFWRSRYDALSALMDRSYSMHMGEIRMLFRRMYIVNQPDLIRRIFIDEVAKYPKSKMVAHMLEILMGNSMFVSNGEVWKRQRRMMEPVFAQARIKLVFGLMLDAVNDMLARVDKLATGNPVQIEVEMTHVTADIIYRTIFSQPLSADDARTIYTAFMDFQEAAYDHGMVRVTGFPDFLTRGMQKRARASARDIRAVLDPHIIARYEAAQRGEKGSESDILGAMIAARDPVDGSPFTLAELCEQVAMIFLAGHETTASSLSWALYLLANDMSVQDRLHSEASSVFGNREPQFSDMKRVPLAWNVFRESLRLYPPIPFLPRQATEQACMRDKVIQPGSIVSVSPWLMHHHRRHWAKPDEFDPDRFDRPESEESQRCAYMPFGLGPRVCLGASFAMQEGVLILASLARRYKVEPDPTHEPKPIGRITVRSENGVRVKLTRRGA
jgi:cytochrome P450